VALTRRTSRSRFTLVLLVLVSVTLLTLDSRGFGPLDAARSAALAVFAPVGDTAAGVLQPVSDTWNGAFGYGDVRRENEALKARVDDLQGRIVQGQASQQELEQLKRSLDLPFAGQIPTAHARVSSGAVSNFDDTIEIDKGTSSGIEKGMPVVSGGGLIGSVQRSSDGRSVIKLVTDRSFQVGVNVPNGAGRGVVAGLGDATTVRADQFDVNTPLDRDAILVTSGASRSFFPPGIPVGTVVSVTTDDTTQQKVADVKLTTNPGDVTYVTVLLYKPPAN
jgi:rod shape-determining protein MreC